MSSVSTLLGLARTHQNESLPAKGRHDVSDTSLGAGWWLASDGKWYPPELAPPPPPPPPPPQQVNPASARAQSLASATGDSAQTSSQPAAEAGTLPSTGILPPTTAGTMPRNGAPASGATPPQVLKSDLPQGEEWWQGTDGNWYAPEVHPSNAPQAPDWWQATNGQWYAPMFHPDYASRSEIPPRTTSAGTMLPKSAPASGASPQQVLKSDRSQGEGWWQGSDGNWYAPEVHPSDTPQGQDWWQASNEKWYAPMFHPDNYAAQITTSPTNQVEGAVAESATAPTGATGIQANDTAPERALVSAVFQGDGWWEATDGKWYAPEVRPSDTRQRDDWWQATNGKWYAPMFHPDYAPRGTPPPRLPPPALSWSPAATEPTDTQGDESPTDNTGPTLAGSASSCPNRHPVAPGAAFCDQCGTPLADLTVRSSQPGSATRPPNAANATAVDLATDHGPAAAAKQTPGGGTPFIKKRWFWVAVVGLIIVVVVVVVVFLVVASSNNNFFSPPSPSALPTVWSASKLTL